MKSFVFLLLLLLLFIPILSFAQDKDKIANFINDIYGNNYYFLNNNPRSIVFDELDEDWEEVLSKEEIEAYKVALKSQTINFNWKDFPLKKAIFCTNGSPIISEKNIPIDLITFVSKKLTKYKQKEIFNTSTYTIFYNGKELTEEKKKKLYSEFLKKFDKKKKNDIRSFSQPIFFGNNYVLMTESSELERKTCVFKLETNIWKLSCNKTIR